MNEITKQQKCIKMRNNISIWIDEEVADKIEESLKQGNSGRFIKVEGNLLNVVDITGIYTPKALDEYTREKNGEWKCKYGNWHKKGQECECNNNKRTSVIFDQDIREIKTIIENGVEKVVL
ncbi:MAG: hypothetical protein EOL97_14060 [Spirochaetia bacterium]|nr:hypothetical protein [Spirochaetia bacterium]